MRNPTGESPEIDTGEVNRMERIKIGVIGGGAAGMMAAITAAGEGAAVTLLEGGERVGKKILSTGNGKCNFGNLQLGPENYCGAAEEWVRDCLDRFGSRDSMLFFQRIGLMVKEKNGYLYPMAEQAAVVLDVLRTELRACGVELITECKVEEVHKAEANKAEKPGFEVRAGKRTFHFDRIILACGSQAAPKTGSDGSGYGLARSLGHKIVPVVPALVQLRCEEPYLKEVAGVRTEAAIRILPRDKDMGTEPIYERGELQLVDYGISGIPVFQLSRKVNYMLRELENFPPNFSQNLSRKNSQVEISIDLLPDYDGEDFARLCAGRKLLLPERTVEEFFTGMLNKKLMHLFIKLAEIKRDMPVAELGEEKLSAVFALCKDWRLHVTGSNSFDSAQVCAGGVDTREVSRDMESLLVPGVYFAGEILDVDGRCGGYNLHWAWCSGYLAGRSSARV